MSATHIACRVCRWLTIVTAVAALNPPRLKASPPASSRDAPALSSAFRDPDGWRALVEHAEVSVRDEHGNTILHHAALRGDAEAVELLLARGADPGATNNAQATPLHYGIRSERIVRALLARGAPVDPVSDAGVTPLLGAVACGDSFGVARQLIAGGANVNQRRKHARGPYAAANVLAVAIRGGDRRTIRLLLDKGADVNPAVGITPLCSAAFVNDLTSTREMLERGADPNRPSVFAGSALNYALLTQHYEVARLLIDRGADLNTRSQVGHGMPPMVWSAYNDHGDATIARLLVARGVDVNVSNDAGETALSYAVRRGGDTPIVQFLRTAGAKRAVLPTREKPVPRREVPTNGEERAALVRDSAQRAIDLLQRSSTAFLENAFVRETAKCVTCHQQALPAVAFGWARERGLRVNTHELGRQLHATVSQRAPQAEQARQMDEPTASSDFTLGYDADGLDALRYAPDEVTAAFSHYLLGTQQPDGFWRAYIRRPPIEDGAIVGTAWSVRAVQLYPPPGREREAGRALERAADWLARQPVRSHNERVFQLLGLAWANATEERMRGFGEKLISTQRPDGSWTQLPEWPGDAWATGSALVALHKAGFKSSHPAYQTGLDFLLRTQFEDGSWWVRSRSWPFQPHFDSQFPHGKDQWISAAGTAWATMALLLTMDPCVDPATLPDGRALMAGFATRTSKSEAVAARTMDVSPLSRPSVTFARDIQPLVERSCAACHGGTKVKGGFSLASRESILKGGQSGEPAVLPGRSAESPLVRYISGQIEDLEMPPLHRRDDYPPLGENEIALVRAWIDGGAVWNP